jgi:hypothetical protein
MAFSGERSALWGVRGVRMEVGRYGVSVENDTTLDVSDIQDTCRLLTTTVLYSRLPIAGVVRRSVAVLNPQQTPPEGSRMRRDSSVGSMHREGYMEDAGPVPYDRKHTIIVHARWRSSTLTL